MKTIILTIVFFAVNITAQWQPDFRLTYTFHYSFTSGNNGWCVAASGDFVHVAWAKRLGYTQISYNHSTDGGVTWGQDITLTNDTWYYTGNPSIAVSGMNVHIIWVYNHNASNDLFYRHSADGGFSWGPVTGFGFEIIVGQNTIQPSITASGSNVYIVWSSGINEIYCKRSTDGGASWQNAVQLTNITYNSFSPSVSASGMVVNVVWHDTRDANGEIYNRRSLDGGASWGPETRLTNDPQNSFAPSVSVSGMVVNVAWADTRDGNEEIYQKRSSDGGTSWGSDIRLTNNNFPSENPSINSSGQNVHVIWQDGRDGNWEIYYKRSANGGISWDSDLRLTNNPANSQFPFISASGTAVHAVWTDDRDGNQEIYYKRNPTGNVLGITPINSEIPESYNLLQNFPNPFNPSTKIKFEIPNSKSETNPKTEIRIYDVTGKMVETIVNEDLKPGTYEVTWNAAKYSSGVYFYKMISGNFTETKKMLMIK
jgi:type IX secretion system substrate protein